MWIPALRRNDSMVYIFIIVIIRAFPIFSKTILQIVSADKTVCKTILQKRNL
jgi:hypothetical protein